MQYLDLLIEDGGLAMDDGQQPQMTTDIDSVGQDVRHRIMESGLARALLGNRSRAQRAKVLTQIEILTANDMRLDPVFIRMEEIHPQQYVLHAKLLSGESITVKVPL